MGLSIGLDLWVVFGFWFGVGGFDLGLVVFWVEVLAFDVWVLVVVF